MSCVITYRLAYLPAEYALCASCVERDDHDRGTLGPVQHGEHEGACQGRHHSPRGAELDSQREIDEIGGAS